MEQGKAFIIISQEKVSYFLAILYSVLGCCSLIIFLFFPIHALVSSVMIGAFCKSLKSLSRRKRHFAEPRKFAGTHQVRRTAEYAKVIAFYLGFSEGRITWIHRLADHPWIRRFRFRSQKKKMPLETRIASVANAWDFLTWKPILKTPSSEAVAVEILRKKAGVEWDSRVVAAFLAAYEDGKIQEIGRKYKTRIWKEEKRTLEQLEKFFIFSPAGS